MSVSAESKIPITVELSAALSVLANAKGIRAFESRVASALSSLLGQFGLSGEPSVTVLSVNSSRALRIRVHGTLQPYEPNLMKRIWLTVTPSELHGITDDIETGRKSGFPDGWFTAFVSNASGNKADLGITFEYLARLVAEIIAERPGCLVGPGQTSAYLRTAPIEMPEAASLISPEEMSSLLKSLLDLGVYVANTPLIWQAIAVSRHLDRKVEDIAESVFTQLRSPSIEIHVHPQYLNKCLNVTPLSRDESTPSSRFEAVRKFVTNVIGTLGQQRTVNEPLSVYSDQVGELTRVSFRQAEERVFNELGLQLPELVFVASTEVQEGSIAVKINDRLGPPIRGLQPGELFVNASIDQLTALNVPGRRANNQVSDEECAIVSDAHEATVQQGGLSTLDSSSFVALILHSEVGRQAARLLGVEDTEYQLAQLKQVFPTLIQAVTARFSVEALTRLMRGLVSEGISIRDARTVFEHLLQFDTITVASSGYVFFDERLELCEARASDKPNSWQNHCAFVRNALRNAISHKYSPHSKVMSVYGVAPQVQSRAEGAPINEHITDTITWLDENEQETLKDSIWSQVNGPDSENGMAPILTTANARIAIRELIAPEMPGLPVIAFSELAPHIKTQQRATIGLDWQATNLPRNVDGAPHSE